MAGEVGFKRIEFLIKVYDSEQFYSNGSNVHFDGGGSEQLNYAHSVAPGMHTRSAF